MTATRSLPASRSASPAHFSHRGGRRSARPPAVHRPTGPVRIAQVGSVTASRAWLISRNHPGPGGDRA
jgi:hypothetical protein